MRSSSIHALICVEHTALDGIFIFLSALFVFPLNMMNGGNILPAAVQYNTAVIRFFQEFVERTGIDFFPLESITLFGTISKKTGVSSILQIYYMG